MVLLLTPVTAATERQILVVVLVGILVWELVLVLAALVLSFSNTKYPLKQYLHLLLLQTGRLL
jgi:hypothetical protein